MLWLDGFRTPDGKVRQYIFTEEEARSVAKHVIGEDRVFAIGVAFYLSKNAKPVPQYAPVYRGGWNATAGFTGTKSINQLDSGVKTCHVGGGGTQTASYNAGGFPPDDQHSDAELADDYYSSGTVTCDSGPIGSSGLESFAPVPRKRRSAVPQGMSRSVTPAKNLEVGAGASINQEVYKDPQSLDYWSEEPVGIIYVNYCSEEIARSILEQGKRAEVVEGYMAGLPVGN
jgi:hypothetical protein